jgi:hypothetical protein
MPENTTIPNPESTPYQEPGMPEYYAKQAALARSPFIPSPHQMVQILGSIALAFGAYMAAGYIAQHPKR